MGSDKGVLVQEYLSKFPDHGDLTVAKVLYKKHPEWWSTLEACRGSVKYYRGHSGESERAKRPKDDPFVTEPTGDTTPFRWSIPEPLNNFGESEPIIVRSSKTLILSDIHAPYHNVAALEAAINHGLKRGVNAVILNGDTLDFFTVSRWEKDPRLRNLGKEIEIGREIVKTIRQAFAGKQIFFKMGNHEERWQSYLSNKAPELIGIPDFEIEKIFHLDDLNMRVVDNRQHLVLGSLNVVHGHELGKMSSPVNPSRGLFLRGGASAIMGHLHRTSEHIEKNMNDDVVACYSTGCLCDLRPDYARYNKWNHGFAIVETGDLPAHFGVENVKLINGRLV